MFGYLKANPKRKLFFDPQHPTIDERLFAAHDCYDFYQDTKDVIPADALTPKVNVVSTHFFVDTDHAGDRSDRRYQTRVLIFVNKSPIICYSKQYNTVETSNFLREFIALNTATELIEALWYKLQMFGIPIEGPSKMFCNNESVYKNVLTHDSTLKKKNISIFYHKCRESVAAGLDWISKEGKATNLYNMFTKILVHIRRETLLGKFTY